MDQDNNDSNLILKHMAAICVLQHRIENQIIFHDRSHTPLIPTSSHQQRKTSGGGGGNRMSSYGRLEAHAPLTTVRSRSSSIGERISLDGDLLDRFSKFTLPKDFALTLRKKITKSLEGKAHHHDMDGMLSNPLTRRIFNDFSSSLTDQYNETLNLNRRPETLIVLFCARAHTVIQKIGTVNEDIYTYLIVFVTYCIDTLSHRGNYFTHRSLVRNLESYLEALKKGDVQLTPSATQSSRHSMSHLNPPSSPPARFSIAVKKTLEPDPNITFDVRQMELAQNVIAIFQIPTDLMQTLVNECSASATEAAALADLIKCKNSLLNQNLHPAYSVEDFTTQEYYAKWKSEELKRLDDDIESLQNAIPSLKKKLSLKQALASPPVYLPHYPLKFYHVLVSKCLKYESHMAGLDSESLELSPASSKLLEKATLFWRISPTSEAAIFMNEVKHCIEEELISFNALVTTLFPSCIEGLRNTNPYGRKQIFTVEWTKYEKAVVYTSLLHLVDSCVSEILKDMDAFFASKITREAYDESRLGKIVSFLDNWLYGFPAIDGLPPLTISKTYKANDVVQAIATTWFDDIAGELERRTGNTGKGDTFFQANDLIEFIRGVNKLVQEVSERYEFFEVAPKTNLGYLVGKSFLLSFCKYMKVRIMDNKQYNTLKTVDIYTFKDLTTLLDVLWDSVTMFKHVTTKASEKSYGVQAFRFLIYGNVAETTYAQMEHFLIPLISEKIEYSLDDMIEKVEAEFENGYVDNIPGGGFSSKTANTFGKEIMDVVQDISFIKTTGKEVTQQVVTMLSKVSDC